MGEQRAWNGLTTIHFYLREGYFGSALSECEKRLIESNEPRLVVLRGLTLVFLGEPLFIFHRFYFPLWFIIDQMMISKK